MTEFRKSTPNKLKSCWAGRGQYKCTVDPYIDDLGAVSIWKCCLFSIVVPIIKIRLISIMGISIPGKTVYIGTGPRLCPWNAETCLQLISALFLDTFAGCWKLKPILAKDQHTHGAYKVYVLRNIGIVYVPHRYITLCGIEVITVKTNESHFPLPIILRISLNTWLFSLSDYQQPWYLLR